MVQKRPDRDFSQVTGSHSVGDVRAVVFERVAAMGVALRQIAHDRGIQVEFGLGNKLKHAWAASA